jgi:hypothetical protein
MPKDAGLIGVLREVLGRRHIIAPDEDQEP